MILLVDTNVLVYALDADDPRHGVSRTRLEDCRSGRVDAGVTGGILAELAASLTWPGRQTPVDSRRCKDIISRMMACRLRLFSESPDSCELFLDLVAARGLSGQSVHDAHHAAIALASGCDGVLTFDAEHWRRFERHGLRLVAP